MSGATGRILRAFLSTLSLRRATSGHEQAPYIVWISIHALLAESDYITTTTICIVSKFLSTLSLRRATFPLVVTAFPGSAEFLSTLSLRRATLSLNTQQRHLPFLSTLSLRRATARRASRQQPAGDFYPRSPCGERHLRVLDGSKSSIISIHALLAESDGIGHIS